MKKNKKRHPIRRAVLWSLLGSLIAVMLVFTHFGGFNTGKSADPAEVAAYAEAVEDIAIPQNVRIIALGEATHGNAEFQQLKLDVFRLMVEQYGVRAFALEGDFGGCEQVNRYIHGGSGTAREAAAAIGFAIYRTEQMEALISYMRQYNDAAAPGDDLRFYGFDMQRYSYSLRFLTEACKALGVNTDELEKMTDGESWKPEFDNDARTEAISRIRAELEDRENAEQAIHFADMLLQNMELGKAGGDLVILRDKLMAQNVQWIAQQESVLGHERLFIAGHNMHVAKWGSMDSMGKLLADEWGEGYYAIGTDFYRSWCNLPNPPNGKRIKQVFYSHDPLAKAARQAGLPLCWLDFAKVPKDSALGQQLADYCYMGSLGEGYGWYMRLLPPSYRVFQPPAVLYDSMIFVAEAHPTAIWSEE